MNYKKTSFLANFYRLFYLRTELPKGFCDYFFYLLFAFILTPLVWPALVLNFFSKSITKKADGSYSKKYQVFETGLGFILQFLFLFSGALGFTLLNSFGFTFEKVNIFYLYFLGIIALPVFAFLFFGIIFSGALLFDRAENFFHKFNKRNGSDVDSQNFFVMIKNRFKSFKEKNCPKINWID